LGRFAEWTNKNRKLLSTQVSKGNPKDSALEQRPSPIQETDEISPSSDLPSDQRGSPWSHFAFALRFFFTILPVQEIHFVCVTLPQDMRKSFQKRSSKATDPKAEGTEQTEDRSNIKSNSSGNSEEQNRAHSWELREWIREPVSAAFSFVRVCAVPGWICLLSLEYVFLLMVYGVAFLLFKDGPIRESGGVLWNWLPSPYEVFQPGRDVVPLFACHLFRSGNDNTSMKEDQV
jgi:hypothetical protein